MRCAVTTAPPGPSSTTYEAELAAMNRRRTALFNARAAIGGATGLALAAIAAGACPACAAARAAASHRGDWGWCSICDETWRADPRTAITQRLPAAGGVL